MKKTITALAAAALFAAPASGESMGLAVEEGAAKFYRERGIIIIDGTQAGDYRKERYAVLGKLSVGRDTRMEIAPGSVVFLARDAQIDVDGELAASEVEFRPLPANLYYSVGGAPPQAGPWRGILVGRDGFANISRAKIFGAQYGIHAMFPAVSMKMTPDSVCFAGNAHYNVYTADRYVLPSDTCLGAGGAIPYIPLCTASVQPPPKKEWTRIVPYGAATLVFAGLFTYDMVQYGNNFKKYGKASEPGKAVEYRKGADDARKYAIIHGVSGAVALGATAWVCYTVFF